MLLTETILQYSHCVWQKRLSSVGSLLVDLPFLWLLPIPLDVGAYIDNSSEYRRVDVICSSYREEFRDPFDHLV